jgi:hypothetical protein
MSLFLLTDKFSALKASFKDKAIKALDVAVGLSVVCIFIPHLQHTDPGSRLTGNCAFYLSVCTHCSMKVLC